jgi:putative two-component system response regulator
MDKLIFIVDDNDANLSMVAPMLENEFRVLTMPSAQKMFSLLEKKHPNLILLDIEMPEITGLEAIARLKANSKWKEIPVIFLTGWADEKLTAAAKSAGALDILQKPVISSLLLDSVKQYIS